MHRFVIASYAGSGAVCQHLFFRDSNRFANLLYNYADMFLTSTKIRQKIFLIIVRMSILQAQLKHIMDKKQRNYAKDIGQ